MMDDYQRPVWAEIDLEAIRHNVRLLKRFIPSPTLFMAVVKANGYGHGAVPVARAALEAGANWLGVALVEEGVELRQAGIKSPIQILSEPPSTAARLAVENELIPTVCSKEVAEAISAAAQKGGQKAKIHVKVDTGMNRIGIYPEQVTSFIKYLNSLPSVEVEGLFTHFAVANHPENPYTEEQLSKFKRVLEKLDREDLTPSLKHAANSAATIFFPSAHLDMVRIGIAMYGLYPSPASRERVSLRPALQLKAKVSFVKELPAGQGVSYGLTYRSQEPTQIATLPLGYGDGYSRLLSNKSEVLIGGQRRPVVGNVCMDQLMVDIGAEKVKVGDEAVLIGQQQAQEISVEELAEILGTINYEVVCNLSPRVPRVYKN